MQISDAVFEHIINQLRAHNASKNDDAFRDSFEQWISKTDWVQTDKRFDVLLPWGKHRADVLREYIEHQAGEIQSLQNQLRDSAEQIKELHAALAKWDKVDAIIRAPHKPGTGAERMKAIESVWCHPEPEQAGCRKDDTQVEEPWIEWEGGVCPVPLGALVDVVYRNGEQRNNLPANVVTTAPWDASYLFWQHNNAKGDIVRYRVVKPECEHEWEQSLGQFFATCVKCGKVG